MATKSFITWLHGELEQNGLNADQIDDIFKLINDDAEFMPEFIGRWHEPTDAYPPMMKVLVWHSVKILVLKYINDNCPQAWFRPMFLPLEEQEEFMNS